MPLNSGSCSADGLPPEAVLPFLLLLVQPGLQLIFLMYLLVILCSLLGCSSCRTCLLYFLIVITHDEHMQMAQAAGFI